MSTPAGSPDAPAVAAATRPRASRPAQLALTLGLAALVFWLAYDSGSFPLLSRTTLAILVWWVIGLGVATGLWPRTRPTTAALALGGLLTAFAAWTALSLAWSSNDQATFDEVGRVLLYLGAFALVVLASPWTGVRAWCDALPLAIGVVVVLALVSRLFPDTFTPSSQYDFLPFGQSRLNYPVGYWNGLAILAMLGLPFLLRLALSRRHVALRAAAVAVVPLSAAVVYLASSRGGVATGVVGALAFVALTRERVHALAALTVGCVGVATAVVVLRARPELVNDPGAAVVVGQGHEAAALLVLVALLTGAVYAGVDALVRTRLPRSERRERIALVVLAVVLLAGVVAANPKERFETFKSAPTASETETTGGDYVGSHLASGSGNGRWQYWETAFEQFQEHPLLGGGAGSFAEWWAQHRPINAFALDAHSLYAETLGELGLAGLALLLAFVGVALYVAVDRPLKAGRENGTAAALGAVVIAFLVAAGVDWMWELTVVTVVGLVALGLLASPPSPGARPLVLATPARAGVVAVAVVAVLCQAVPLLATERLRDSHEAVRRGDPEAALDAARSAHRFEPWAYAPYLQLALVHEQLGELREARDAIEAGIRRDEDNWQLWLVKARLQVKSGQVAAARQSLARIRVLDPLGFVPPTR